MTNQEIYKAIELELRRARKKHPNWPVHPAGQAGVVVEEAGELMRACLQWKYEKKTLHTERAEQFVAMRDEAIQVAVTAIRFLQNLK